MLAISGDASIHYHPSLVRLAIKGGNMAAVDVAYRVTSKAGRKQPLRLPAMHPAALSAAASRLLATPK